MAKIPIRTYPDPILRMKASERLDFSEALHALLHDMFETMYDAEGIGLAGPQVGIAERIIVIDLGTPLHEFGLELGQGDQDESNDFSSQLELINPEILSQDGSCIGEEGCLSIPGYREKVTRSERIRVRAQDRCGNPFEFDAHGLLAVCIQHEVDHLDGVLFVDRLSKLKRQLFRLWVRKHVA